MLKTFALSTVLLTAGLGFAAAQQMPGMSNAASPADRDFASGMTKMSNTMAAAPITGNADKDFTAMMIPHHQGAVAMAQTELKYGKDPELRQMARDIITAQDKEIAQMKHWQAAHPQ